MFTNDTVVTTLGWGQWWRFWSGILLKVRPMTVLLAARPSSQKSPIVMEFDLVDKGRGGA
jgi:hypothetical protein